MKLYIGIFLINFLMIFLTSCLFLRPPVKDTPLPSTANGSYISQADFNTLATAIVQGCK